MSENDKMEDTEATEESTTEKAMTDEVTTTPETIETKGEEVKPAEEATTEEAKARYLSVSTGTGLTVFNGSCPKCGARIANGIVKDEKEK